MSQKKTIKDDESAPSSIDCSYPQSFPYIGRGSLSRLTAEKDGKEEEERGDGGWGKRTDDGDGS